MHKRPDLLPVIAWLERGADVADAIKELRLIQPQIEALANEREQAQRHALLTLGECSAWLDGLGEKIHTYSLRGIALAAWTAANTKAPT